MSKLPKAPLVEVVFELKWDIKMKSDLDDFQYLYGDLYANLKDEFPNRERLTPLEIPFDALINIPVFRFTKNENKYPLIQIGPGVISINTLNEFYVWEDFRENIHQLLDILKDIYPKFQTLKIIPALIYIDFLKFNDSNTKGYNFINQNFNISINSNILNDIDSTISDININTNYQIGTDILSIRINEGKANNSTDGIVLQTKVNGNGQSYDKESLKEWLESAHLLSSKTFKSLIKEDLYNTFN